MMRGSVRPVLTMLAGTPAFSQKVESVIPVGVSSLPAREYTVKEPLSIWTTWFGPTEPPMSGGMGPVPGGSSGPRLTPRNWLTISPPSPPWASDGVAESMISRHDHNQTHDINPRRI